MTRTKQTVGKIVIPVPVIMRLGEVAVPRSAAPAVHHALAQVSRALQAFGPFALGLRMLFVDVGIELDVIDASTNQDATFDRAAFESFLRRAHDSCSAAMSTVGKTSEQLADVAESFAMAERCSADDIKAMFDSLTTYSSSTVISPEGELIDVGVVCPAKAENALEIDIGVVTKIARVHTTHGSFDVPAAIAEELRVGQCITIERDEPPARTACIRAAQISALDQTGGLFDDSPAAQTDRNPDNAD